MSVRILNINRDVYGKRLSFDDFECLLVSNRHELLRNAGQIFFAKFNIWLVGQFSKLSQARKIDFNNVLKTFPFLFIPIPLFISICINKNDKHVRRRRIKVRVIYDIYHKHFGNLNHLHF